ncbi:hypothetical protein CGGC5_v015907 [Colletotrichum fructicola Nara gc5]|uniref:Uncharacterized protein n=1 Tax=Colletotrichum fructicola (strain Nara gc5) TaxID=1213859 RepID=A0A7J6IEA8_COLFN|nr:hypothetical protein CFRS1_v005649 [Colletotrichum fructicola]KAF4474758.1 hypothetical protein CGGC5_v015907 [Colletotrichum fructicola Nara gc5]
MSVHLFLLITFKKQIKAIEGNHATEHFSKSFKVLPRTPNHYHFTSPATMTQSKADKINEVQQNLPLPEQPPVASDWQSADARNVNVGSGGDAERKIGTETAATSGLREPASKAAEDLSSVGRQGVEGLSGAPKDAAAR